jgi:hypothetical protein
VANLVKRGMLELRNVRIWLRRLTYDDEDDGPALRGGGRLQGSPGRLLAMERTRKAT